MAATGRSEQTRRAFIQASQALSQAQTAARSPDIGLLQTTAGGFASVVSALGAVGDDLLDHARGVLAGRERQEAGEILADLHAVRRLLHTATLLLDPVLVDLTAIAASIQHNHDRARNSGARDGRESAVPDDIPDADAADQARPALHDDLDAEIQALRDEPDHDTTHPPDAADDTLVEADPADVADQLRIAPVLDDDQPWP